MRWDKVRPIGAGLQNMGNTCFLNSVLQCLLYTPPLANILLSGGHGSRCKFVVVWVGMYVFVCVYRLEVVFLVKTKTIMFCLSLALSSCCF